MELVLTSVDTGNPHAVIFLEDNPVLPALDAIIIEKIGTELQQSRFPEGVNTEFISIINRGEVLFRVWERGSGETLACGTGAVASVFAGIMAGKLDEKVLVHLAGGDLVIRYDREEGKCFMTGPAEEVFSGSLRV